jgi:DNA-binding response OmpR family regulator
MKKHGKSILVVDDHEISVKLLRQILADAGFDVFTAFSGEEAIKLVQDFKPDLILLDIVMDGLNGYKTCQALKIMAPALPVIFFSAVPDREKGIQLGAVDYINKPFQMKEVLECVKYHLGIGVLEGGIDGDDD